MPTENSKVALEFDADDVIEGLIKFIQHGEKAEAILGAIAVAGTKMAYDLIIDLKKTTEAVIQPFTQAAQVVAHVDKAFKDAKESVRQVREETAKVDISNWEKQALRVNHLSF